MAAVAPLLFCPRRRKRRGNPPSFRAECGAYCAAAGEKLPRAMASSGSISYAEAVAALSPRSSPAGDRSPGTSAARSRCVFPAAAAGARVSRTSFTARTWAHAMCESILKRRLRLRLALFFPNELVRLKERDVFVRQMAERARRAPGIAQEAAEIVLREPAALRGEPRRVLPGVQAQNRRFSAGDAAHQLFAHGSRGGRIRVSLRRLEQRPRREDDAPRRVLRHASGTGVQPRERILFFPARFP